MASGKWTQQGVPHKGWQFLSLEDLGDLTETCQMCETQPIRYVHRMEHPTYADVLRVGSVCAGRMEEDYATAQQREKEARATAKRRTKWMQAQWRESAKGNSYINRNGFNIVIYPHARGWSYRILHRQTEEVWTDSGFTSKNDAKLAAFECYVNLNK